MVRAALGITWPETISTAELTQRDKLIPLSRTIRKRRLRHVGHVIRMQPRCQTPLGTLLTTVPKNCQLRQGHGRTSTLQHNVADHLRSINCDVTSIQKVCEEFGLYIRLSSYYECTCLQYCSDLPL